MKNDNLEMATLEAALRKMVELGEWAHGQLTALNKDSQPDVGWDELFEEFLDKSVGVSMTSKVSCRRWMEVLQEKAAAVGVVRPMDITTDIALKLCREIAECYVSAPRMIRFYRRLWQCLKLGKVWPTTPVKVCTGHERYRRLSVDEVRSLVRALSGKQPANFASEGSDSTAVAVRARR